MTVRALDRRHAEAAPPVDARAAAPDLSCLFAPRSVAVIGASSDPTRIGGLPIAFMQRHGFTGRIYPVNGRRGEVQGLASFESLADLPEAPDVAIVSVRAAQVMEQLERCAAKRAKFAIVFSSGFAETGEAGAAAQAEITAFARRTGVRVLGPNALGVMDTTSRALLTFSAAPQLELPRAGGLAIASQSGAFGTYTFVAAARRGLPIGRWLATGNEADLDVADAIAWLAQDDATRVIMAYLEGARDGRKLMAALERAQAAGKPVVVMKVGRTEAGAAAARSHTSALAGSDRVFDAVLRQCGAHRAESFDEFLDVGYGCLVGLEPRSRRVGVITVSGGAGVLMADAASEAGLDVAPLPEPAQAALHARLPFAAAANPVDVTGQSANDPTLFLDFLDVMVREGGYGAVAAFLALGGVLPRARANIVSTWTEARARFPDTPVFLTMMSEPDVQRELEALGIPVYDEPTRMVRAIAHMAALAEARVRRRGSRAPLGHAPLGGEAGTEAGASALLSAAGLPMAAFEVAQDADTAAAAAARLGFPVALKVLSPDIAHKSDVGGVALGLADAPAVAAAFEAMTARVAAAAPQARLQGALVSPMAPPGVEFILSAHHDPSFGPVVMLGTGGVLVEVMDDVAFRAAPLDRDEAAALVAELRASALLDGVRGAPPADREALVDAIVALGAFAAAHAGAFGSVEINPLRVLPRGQGAVGLDALFT